MRQRNANRVKRDASIMQLVIASVFDSKKKASKQLEKILKRMDESD